MDRDRLYGELVRIMSDAFDLDSAAITPDARLVEDLDLDSIDAVDLSVKMQDLIGRKLTDDEIRSIRTVGDVIDVVLRVQAS